MTTTTVPRRLAWRAYLVQPHIEPERAQYGVELALSLAYDMEDFEVYSLLSLVRPDLTAEQINAKVDDLLNLADAAAEATDLRYSAEAFEAAQVEYTDALRSFVGAL